MIDISKNVFVNRSFYAFTPSEIARKYYYHIQDVGEYVCGKGHMTIRENMKSFLLVFTCSGEAFLNYRGKDYVFKPGDVFLIDCMKPHKYGSSGKLNWHFYYVHFHGNNSHDLCELFYNTYGVIIDKESTCSIITIMKEFLILSKNRDAFFEIRCNALIAKLLSELIISAAFNFGETKNNHNNEIVTRAISFMEENYRSPILIDDIAKAAFTSRYHFTRVFKKMTGITPYAYLTNYRISIAKKQLKLTSSNISNIAIEVGFDSPSNFTRTFRLIEGVTPTIYRKF